jgi:hypothetical protein
VASASTSEVLSVPGAQLISSSSKRLSGSRVGSRDEVVREGAEVNIMATCDTACTLCRQECSQSSRGAGSRPRLNRALRRSCSHGEHRRVDRARIGRKTRSKIPSICPLGGKFSDLGPPRDAIFPDTTKRRRSNARWSVPDLRFLVRPRSSRARTAIYLVEAPGRDRSCFTGRVDFGVSQAGGRLCFRFG